MTMKRIIEKLMMAVVLIAAAACSKEEGEPKKYIDPAFVGEWHLTEATSEGVTINDNLDVYIVLNEDGSFEIYQQNLEEQLRYDKYTGTYYCQSGLMTGVYSDGKSWGAKYIPSVSDDRLTLKSNDFMEVQKYKRESLSEEEKQDASIVSVKSSASVYSPIL